VPSEAAQVAFFRDRWWQLNELGRERRMRVHAGGANIPPMMWGFFIVGGSA